MKDQLFMSPNNGEVVIGIPLFRQVYTEKIDVTTGYSILLSSQHDRPLAYILDMGTNVEVYSAYWVEENLINLGDL